MAVDTIFKFCYNRNKLGNTAKFVKTLRVVRAFTKQVDQ